MVDAQMYWSMQASDADPLAGAGVTLYRSKSEFDVVKGSFGRKAAAPAPLRAGAAVLLRA